MISYGKLWLLLEQKNMKRTDLLTVISTPTLAKLGKNENINVSMIGKICDYLDCQPGDIMENVSEQKLQAVAEQFDMLQRVMVKSLKEQGIGETEVIKMINESLPAYMKKLFNGESPTKEMLEIGLGEMKRQESKNEIDEKS